MKKLTFAAGLTIGLAAAGGVVQIYAEESLEQELNTEPVISEEEPVEAVVLSDDSAIEAVQPAAADLEEEEEEVQTVSVQAEAEKAPTVLNATMGDSGTNASFKAQADALVKANEPFVMAHEAAGSNALEEAENFYNAVSAYIGKGLPMLNWKDNLSGGTVWVQDFLDTFTSLSGVRPVVSASQYALDNYDWSSVEANGYSFDIPSSSEWKEAVTPDSEVTAVKDMYRLYNPNSGEHFYTASLTERNYLVNVGWQAEGIGWTAPSKNELMIYRLYNPNAGDHHYTLSSVERDHLVSVGWRYEGVGWYSDASKTMAVYRAYNPNAAAGAHNFTTSKAEQDYLVSLGWRDEGIAWYSSTPVLGRVEVKTDNYTISTGNVTKCYNTEGKMLKGVQKVNGNLYYFDTSTGILGKTTGLVTHDSGTYLVQSGGVLATGFQSVSNALKYFSKTTGQMVKSAFVYVSQGVFNWFDANGTQAKGTINLSGTSYTFDSTGKLTNHIDIVEQKFVTKKDDISYFVDANSGTNIRFYQYILDNYGNSTLKAMLTEAVKYESWPYVWAGKSPEYGFDCSGLVSYVAKTALGKNINPIMTSAEYLYSGYCTPVSQSDAKPGSLVFWYGTYGSSLNYITHVGIYVGNGWMFNAGDPIGFGRVDKVTNILGQTASYVFGNLK